MAREPAPAFQFYPRDWLASSAVTRMTPEQRGCYIQLLSYCWLDGSLPTDDADLAQLAGCGQPRWQRIGALVRQQFTERDGRLYQARLDSERSKQAEYRSGATEHGRKGARARWNKMPEHCPSNARAMPGDGSASSSAFASSVQTPTVSESARPKPLAYRPRIDVVWPGRPPVPSSLHAEFVSKLGGDEQVAHQRLIAWYPTAAAPYQNHPIGDDDFRFWRARFREWQGTTARPVDTVPRVSDAEILADVAAQKALRARR